MNGFDYAGLAVVAMAVRRGYRAGLAAEFYRLFRMAVALLVGTSLYGVLSDAVSGLLNVSSGFSDPVLFLGSSFGVWTLLRRLRRGMEAIILARVPANAQAWGGAVAAGVKAAVLIAGLAATVVLSPWMPGHDAVAGSALGGLVQAFLPGS